MFRAANIVAAVTAVATVSAFSPPTVKSLITSTAKGRQVAYLSANLPSESDGNLENENGGPADNGYEDAINLGADLRARLKSLKLDPLAVRFSAVEEDEPEISDNYSPENVPPADEADGGLVARMRALGLDPTRERNAASQRVAESSAEVQYMFIAGSVLILKVAQPSVRVIFLYEST